MATSLLRKRVFCHVLIVLSICQYMLCCGSLGFPCKVRLALSPSMAWGIDEETDHWVEDSSACRNCRNTFCCSEVSAWKRMAGQKAWKRKLQSQVLSIPDSTKQGHSKAWMIVLGWCFYSQHQQPTCFTADWGLSSVPKAPHATWLGIRKSEVASLGNDTTSHLWCAIGLVVGMLIEVSYFSFNLVVDLSCTQR